jgi:hypothetical protein
LEAITPSTAVVERERVTVERDFEPNSELNFLHLATIIVLCLEPELA